MQSTVIEPTITFTEPTVMKSIVMEPIDMEFIVMEPVVMASSDGAHNHGVISQSP